MTLLSITRGLPGSGKTFYARQWVASDPGKRARVNRDDLRQMLNEGARIKGVTEAEVIAVRDAAITSLLRKGFDVISDDTNLPQGMARDLLKLAIRTGSDFEVTDFTDRTLGECLKQNAYRTDKPPVPEEFILDMHKRFLAGRTYPLPFPEEAQEEAGEWYYALPGTPEAVIVDVDGTVALNQGRNPYDMTRVGEDAPNLRVLEAVRMERDAGRLILFISGRNETGRAATKEWLHKHFGAYEGLWMRGEDDKQRRDAIVKLELFDKYIRQCYNVRRVYDDRDQVVVMWRSIGLTCLQVAPGAF